MALVNLTVSGRVYEIACDDSQIDHIQELGRLLDTRAQDLLRQVGPVPDARLMLMVGLMLADEMLEARAALSRLNQDVSAAAAGDAAMAKGIDALAERIEGIAERLERA